MDIYKDIINELEKQNYDVTYFEDFAVDDDPFLIRNRTWPDSKYRQREKQLTKYWKSFFDGYKGNLNFDVLLVVEGTSICDMFIDEMSRHNPQIKKILYLYDRTYNNYRFDLNFHYFDRVFTFDRLDSKKYNINLLPIYWVPVSETEKTKFLLFGFATFQKERYRIFKDLYYACNYLGKDSYVKLYIPKGKNNFKLFIKRVLRKDETTKLDPDLVSNTTLTPSDFREYISLSEAVLDTHNSFQDGLTARFMWALGAGKKIITTNKSIKEYSFYNNNQVYILGVDEAPLNIFLSSDLDIPDSQKEIIKKFRIDNWIKTLIS